MASEITLKYLHPNVKTYITTQNYNFDTSVNREVLFVADVFEHGKDNVLQEVTTLSEYLFKYGEPNLKRYGQAGYNIERWLANGNSAVIMRLLPEDASYAHAVLNVQYKNATNGKTVVDANGNETKINDVYLRPVVTYIGVNNTSEKLLESELEEDRTGYPTTDGYIDNFIMAVYPEGRGEYYNDLGFRIRLNPSYDGAITSRVYTFEVVKYSGTTYDIVDGPYFVTFDPEAMDPNSQKSMFIETVVNSYSDYVKVKFNTENYLKLATIINDEVDPYIVDIISGKSRIMSDGSYETYFNSATGKDEDVHIALRKYSTNGTVLYYNGEYILNISNNDESTKDIVDIADNSRRVVYNNQKFVTDYMRGYYNWLIQDRISRNLNKIIDGNIESNKSEIKGLLLEKTENLIYANLTNEDNYSYTYDNTEFISSQVGRSGRNDAWYLKTQEVIHPGLKTSEGAYVGTADQSGFEDTDDVYTSSSEMSKTITPDGFIEATNEHLISYYHNFMKYMQFVINYDVYNNTGFVTSDEYVATSEFWDKAINTAPIYGLYSNNMGTTSYKNLFHLNSSSAAESLKKENFAPTTGYKSILDYVLKNASAENAVTDQSTHITTRTKVLNEIGAAGISTTPQFSYFGTNAEPTYIYPTYIDTTYPSETVYIPIIDLTTWNEDNTISTLGKYVKVYDTQGNLNLQPVTGVTVTAGGRKTEANNMASLVARYLYTGDYAKNNTRPTSSYIDRYCVLNTKNPTQTGDLINVDTDIEGSGINFYTFEGLYKFLNAIFKDLAINSKLDTNIDHYIVLSKRNENISAITYEAYKRMVTDGESDYVEIRLKDIVRFASALWQGVINNETTDGIVWIPDTGTKYDIANFSISATSVPYTDGTTTAYVPNIITDFFFSSSDLSGAYVFNHVFTERLKNSKLTDSYNRVASYASLISKELDGKGKDTIINDLSIKNSEELNYSDYSLTTILNVFVAGFESIVNNMGSITDYSNYSSLKYLMKTINNNLDLRATYLTLLNVHRNTILDLSTSLAKQNASVILGDETLETLYTAMDTIVTETNYLVNIIYTVLNKTYTIFDLSEMTKAVDGVTPYAYYFRDGNHSQGGIDPLGITNNLNNYGRANDDTHYFGVLPLLEKILINITGENHFGDSRNTIYGGPALIDLYDDIKNGYVLGGLTQERYETIYQILSESLGSLYDIYNIINTFVNEKYISDIVNTLIGTLDVNNTVIKFNGSTYSINTLWEFYNSEENDGLLTQNDVVNLINESFRVYNNPQPLPLDSESSQYHPVIAYPYSCKTDIEDSVSIANTNKEIVKNNILKQDRVLASLNTLCYDNLVTDIKMPLGLAEGSDGSFRYDDSTSAALKARQHKINDIRIKAYKGTWNEDVLNKDLFEFDHVLDANYEDAVKNAIITLARDERQDFFYWADTKIQNTLQDCLDWKTSFTNQTYFMSVIAQSQVWYDEYTSKNINLTSTYLIADMLGRHIDSYGIHYPMAGSRRGVVGGFISNDWYPNEEQKEKLYTNKINYLEKDITTIRIGAQNTNYPTGPLGQINNMLVLLRIKRTVEKIAKTYQFEFNTADTRAAMAAEINTYLGNWINNGACTVATATVYASDYDIIQKIVRVDVTLQFTGVIERIVINIDCPAAI